VAEQAGSKTQVTGLVGALAITLMLLFAPGLLRNLPQPTLAAVVISAALSLADVPGTLRLFRQRRTEFSLSIAAFLGVTLLGVLPGIAIAVALSIGNVFRRCGPAVRLRHLAIRRSADLRQRQDVSGTDPRPGRLGSSAYLDHRGRRADHRCRYDRRGHARGPRRGVEQAWDQSGLRGVEGPGPSEDRSLRADAHH
jgi:Sulfate permease family